MVTGATGTVGSEVVKQLASSSSYSSGQSIIRAAVHSKNKVDKFSQYGSEIFEIVNMDYNKPETIAAALDKVGKLFLLTLPSLNMTDISSKVVREAKKNGVQRIVKLSVFGADAEPGIIIGRLHRQEEKIIEESGITYTFLRSSAFMQNFVNYYGYTIKTQNAIYLPAGEGKVSFVDARDVAAVAAKLLTENNGRSRHDKKAYVVTGSEALSYSQVAEIISKEIGRKISYIDTSEEDARKSMKSMGREDWLIDAILEEFYNTRAGNRSETTNIVEQIIGRKPTSFAQFVRDYANSFN
ncbi:MAG: SDR family oxidoreductase [Nitrososphaeraceae archaeon]